MSKTLGLSKYYLCFFLLITFCLAFLPAAAQSQDKNPKSNSPETASPADSSSALSASDTNGLKTISITNVHGYKWTALSIGSSAGYAVYRDMGTAPFRFKGLVIQPAIGLEFDGMRRWNTSIKSSTSIGIFEDAVAPKFNFGAFDICNTLRFKMQRNIASIFKRDYDSAPEMKRKSLVPENADVYFADIAGGFGFASMLDVTVNPDYENAAAGVSYFVGPELSLKGELSLNSLFNLDWTKPTKILFAEVGLMPLAAVLRPGYAYIDNYTASQPVASSFFDEFEWHLKPLAGMWSDIGFNIINEQYSRISISYFWSYFSSGNSGYWRFDRATHFLHIDFIITLKKKRTGWTKVTEY